MSDDLQVIGLGLATLDVLVRLKEMPTWEHGTRISGFRFDGGGLVGTAMVAAARLGAKVGFGRAAPRMERAADRPVLDGGVRDQVHPARWPGRYPLLRGYAGLPEKAGNTIGVIFNAVGVDPT